MSDPKFTTAAIAKFKAPSPEVAEAEEKAVARNIADNRGFAEARDQLHRLDKEAAPARPAPRITIPQEGKPSSVEETARDTAPSLKGVFEEERRREQAEDGGPPVVEERRFKLKWLAIGAGLLAMPLLYIAVLSLASSETTAQSASTASSPVQSATASAGATAIATAIATGAPAAAASTVQSVQAQTSETSDSTSLRTTSGTESSHPKRSATVRATSATATATATTAAPPVPSPKTAASTPTPPPSTWW